MMSPMSPRTSAPGRAPAFLDKVCEVEVQTDVRYARAGIDHDRESGTSRRHRDLKLDVYRPRGGGDTLRPALILAFGGAFHRGSKSGEVFDGQAVSTTVAEYCREFARRGYVCLSIDYRLMPEAPDPGVTRFLPDDPAYNTDRIDQVRAILGLPPCTPRMIADTLEAATDDMCSAVAFVRSRCQQWGVDLSRVAIGGFSSGAALALNAALAEHVAVAAVVALSGRVTQPVLEAFAQGCRAGQPAPALLAFYGENDLPELRPFRIALAEQLAAAGVDHQIAIVPGATHFYTRTAAVQLAGEAAGDVETVIAGFLHDRLRLAQLGRR